MQRKRHTNRPGGRDCGLADFVRERELAIARLASRQHGVLTRAQLRDAGLADGAIEYRLRVGRLHALHRGVYLVGHSDAPPHAHEMAAILACGPSAVLSHGSAARLWRLLPLTQLSSLHVTVVKKDPGPKPGIVVHRVARLDPREARTCNRVPVTTPSRTLLDLAATVSPPELERAAAEAQVRRLVRGRDLLALLVRNPRHRGAATLRALIESEADPAMTRSEAERRFLSLIRAAELPAPEVNVRVGRHEVDFLWRESGLVVEVDGFRFHSSTAAFERDRARDAELLALGFHVMRVTWRQIVTRPEAMLVRLAQAIAAGSP
jgi:very-short-patch-repair endonuclease